MDPTGVPRAALTVQWRGEPPPGTTRAQQREWLRAAFTEVLSGTDVTVEWHTLSPAARTVDVVVDRGSAGRVSGLLRAAGLRVDTDAEIQVLDDEF